MSITRLVELQDIDSQLEDLNSLLGDLPKMVDELNEKENSLKDRVEADKVSLKEINLNSSKSQKVNSDIQEKINKLTDPLFLVTNNKQYDALNNEIEHLKDQKKENEELLISNLEEKETLEKWGEMSETQKKYVLDHGWEYYNLPLWNRKDHSNFPKEPRSRVMAICMAIFSSNSYTYFWG